MYPSILCFQIICRKSISYALKVSLKTCRKVLMISLLNLALIHIEKLDENTTIVKMLKNLKEKMGFNNGPVLLAVKLPWSINCFYYEKNGWNFELFARRTKFPGSGRLLLYFIWLFLSSFMIPVVNIIGRKAIEARNIEPSERQRKWGLWGHSES